MDVVLEGNKGVQFLNIVIDEEVKAWAAPFQSSLDESSVAVRREEPCSIFRVPPTFHMQDNQAYQPTVISLGPYHSTNNRDRKQRMTSRLFSKATYQRDMVAKCLQKVREQENRARSCYADAIRMESQDFVEMMVLDGCFIIGFLLFMRGYSWVWVGQDHGDPELFFMPEVTFIIEDLIKLENQIPFFIVETLYDMLVLQNPEHTDINFSLSDLAVFLFKKLDPGSYHYNDMNDCRPHHLLHLFHQFLLPGDPHESLIYPNNEAVHFRLGYPPPFPPAPESAPSSAPSIPSFIPPFPPPFPPAPESASSSASFIPPFPPPFPPAPESVSSSAPFIPPFIPPFPPPPSNEDAHFGYPPPPRPYTKIYKRFNSMVTIEPNDSNRRRSLTKLQEAGVKFKRQPYRSFLDVSFKNGEMQIPELHISERTIPILRNLIAFEQCYPFTDNHITFFAELMGGLINTSRDVNVLQEAEILKISLNNEEEMTHLFKRLCTHVYCNNKKNYLENLYNEMNCYCRSRRHRWKAVLMRDYFSNPWTIISVVAAITLLVLTFLQTLYSMVAYYN
ncbi:UPF0481 protein [Acorus calamus]|uniref:UPF0481 protein n=1 Tax=Acorus calamus TaxID=4465 RepID=A0AAV9C1C3_ACOCL|nr:UPF0481 protein [Acorus calamus]